MSLISCLICAAFPGLRYSPTVYRPFISITGISRSNMAGIWRPSFNSTDNGAPMTVEPTFNQEKTHSHKHLTRQKHNYNRTDQSIFYQYLLLDLTTLAKTCFDGWVGVFLPQPYITLIGKYISYVCIIYVFINYINYMRNGSRTNLSCETSC